MAAAAAIACVGGCAPEVRDSEVAIDVLRGEFDPLRAPATAERDASPVGSLELVWTTATQVLREVVVLSSSKKTVQTRFEPGMLTGEARLTLRGKLADQDRLYSAGRSMPFDVTTQAPIRLSVVMAPVETLTPIGPPVQTPRFSPHVTALGAKGGLVIGGTDGTGAPAEPYLQLWRHDTAQFCAQTDPSTEGCLTGLMPAPRTGAIAVGMSDGSVVHGLGRLQDGAMDGTLYLTSRDGHTEALSLSGDALPPLADAAAVVTPDGTVIILGGTTDAAPQGSIFHVDVSARTVVRHTTSLLTPRHSASAVILETGDVLVVGGVGAGGPLDSVELYTPGERARALDGGAFAQVRTRLRAPRVAPSVVRLPDDSVAIIGGGSATGEVFRLTLGPNVGGLVDWAAPPSDKPIGVYPSLVRVGEGEVLLVGGEAAGTAPAAAIFTHPATGSLDATRPTYGGTWRSVQPSAVVRARPGVGVMANGTVLVVGGSSDGEPVLTTAALTLAERVEVLVPAYFAD